MCISRIIGWTWAPSSTPKFTYMGQNKETMTGVKFEVQHINNINNKAFRLISVEAQVQIGENMGASNECFN